MDTAPEFTKPVTAIEKFYIAVDALYRPFVNQLVVLGEGALDDRTLADALARVAAANPGLTLRHRGVLGRMRWVPGPPPAFSAHDAPGWDARSESGAPFLTRPLDARDGPSCELQRVASAAGPCLIFRSLHATMDGGGTRHWADELFRALRGEPLLGSDCAETDHQFAAGLTDGAFEMPPRDALTHAAWDADAPPARRWLRASLPSARTDQVLARIAVAVARRARADAGERAGVVRINVPADLRFFRPDARSTGNLIGAVFEEVASDDTVEEVAERIKARLRAREHARFPRLYDLFAWVPLRRMRRLVAAGVRAARDTGLQQFTATLSYLGEVAPEPLRAPGFEPRAAFFIPPVAQQGCFVTGTRMRGTLELLVSVPAALATGGRIEALVAELGDALEP